MNAKRITCFGNKIGLLDELTPDEYFPGIHNVRLFLGPLNYTSENLKLAEGILPSALINIR